MKVGQFVLGMVFGLSILFVSPQVILAQNSVWSGAGIRMFEQPEPPEAEKPRFQFPKLFSRDKLKSTFGKPFQFPKWPKPSFMKQSSDDDAVNERPDWLDGLPMADAAENDASNQNIFQDWNQKSKDYFAQRKQNFDAWNEKMKARSRANWESFTSGFKPPFMPDSNAPGPFDWLKSKQASKPPTQPPIRSAQIPSDSPRIKF